MYAYASKILPLLVLPLGVTLLLCGAALWSLMRGNTRRAGGFLVTALLVLWISSTPWVAAAALASLERQYPPVPLERIPESGCAILLGGAVAAGLHPRVDPEFNNAMDRVYKAAQLYRVGKARHLIVTAGNQPWSESPTSEAELIREVLVEWGVPEDTILLDGKSRNTRENAVNTKELVDSIGCNDALLVTSAAHMPRALGAFRTVGIPAMPVSTDVRVADSGRLTLLDFVPDAASLAMTSDALREWMGRAYYRWKGWA